MDYEEIDAWYEQQKQELLDQYVKSLEEKKNNKKKEQEFTNKLVRLHKRYEKLFKKSKNGKKIKQGFKRLKSLIKK